MVTLVLVYGGKYALYPCKRVANAYDKIHKHKQMFTNVYMDFCVTFEESQICAPIHAQIQRNLAKFDQTVLKSRHLNLNKFAHRHQRLILLLLLLAL